MSLTQEDLQAIANLLTPMRNDIADMKNDITSMKEDISNMKEDIRNLDQRLTVVENQITEMKLSLENETNHNIQLIAENHMNLVDKLNQAIRVSDKTLLYEVQVSTLKSKVEHLEKEIAEIKKTIA
ncbi:MAG: hypothetical protein UHU19_06710 [Lachnospiraceae bacterium]|nr:hypothetical protein [Lachnospiraceae bacterium]